MVLQDESTVTVPHFKIIGTQLDTQYSNHIRNNNGFLTHAETKNNQPTPLHLFYQQGRKVFKEVTPLVVEHIHRHLQNLNISADSLKRFWLHQANKTMNELICKRILNKNFEEQFAPIILDQYANTSSAGSIICFHLHHADFTSGDQGLICSFGAGYSVGSVTIEKVD